MPVSATDLLADLFDHVRSTAARAVDGLDASSLTWRPGPDANTIAWLVWHLTRVQDDHIADAAGTEQVWKSGSWVDHFALPFDSSDTGYGQTSDEVAEVRVEDPALLVGYLDAVHAATAAYLKTLGPDDLDRVVDERWDPPVTLGVRLASVANDDLQHAGQAAFVRGLLP